MSIVLHIVLAAPVVCGALAPIDPARQAGTLTVAIPATGSVSVFRPEGGRRGWRRIDRRF
ncbi:MAG: hypothetical protein P4M09_27640 [Devosia sp.]|nr:hypothetical protein [Devosia sp.]